MLPKEKAGMKEYTILALISVLVAVSVDQVLKVKILKRKEYLVFLGATLFFKILVIGYLTGKHIVMYRKVFYLGIRIGSIPVEDFLFGFSMVTLTIVFWEYFLSKEAHGG